MKLGKSLQIPESLEIQLNLAKYFVTWNNNFISPDNLVSLKEIVTIHSTSFFFLLPSPLFSKFLSQDEGKKLSSLQFFDLAFPSSSQSYPTSLLPQPSVPKLLHFNLSQKKTRRERTTTKTQNIYLLAVTSRTIHCDFSLQQEVIMNFVLSISKVFPLLFPFRSLILGFIFFPLFFRFSFPTVGHFFFCSFHFFTSFHLSRNKR